MSNKNNTWLAGMRIEKKELGNKKIPVNPKQTNNQTSKITGQDITNVLDSMYSKNKGKK